MFYVSILLIVRLTLFLLFKNAYIFAIKLSSYDRNVIIISIITLIVILLLIILIQIKKKKKYFLFYESKITFFEKVYCISYLFFLFDMFGLTFLLHR